MKNYIVDRLKHAALQNQMAVYAEFLDWSWLDFNKDCMSEASKKLLFQARQKWNRLEQKYNVLIRLYLYFDFLKGTEQEVRTILKSNLDMLTCFSHNSTKSTFPLYYPIPPLTAVGCLMRYSYYSYYEMIEHNQAQVREAYIKHRALLMSVFAISFMRTNKHHYFNTSCIALAPFVLNLVLPSPVHFQTYLNSIFKHI
jgi:hypothetical protein